MAGPVRFAVVGLDHWYSAVPLARHLADRDDTTLVAISDRSIDRAREIAAPLGDIKVTDSGQELIEDPSIDVIVSFVSVDENPDVCIAAAAAGKHIISVKPLARTLAEATRIVEAVRAAGVVFLPSESRGREAAQSRRIYDWVRDGQLGRIVSATLTLAGGLPHGWPGSDDPGWWVDPKRSPGGGWIDHAIYQIDTMRWLLGEEVVGVSGRTANLRHKDLAVEDYGHAILEFSGGAIVTVEDTWSAPRGAHRVTTSILGTDGAVLTDSLTAQISLYGSAGTFDGWTHGKSGSTLSQGIDSMLSAIAGGPQLATVADAWENLSTCVAFYDAAAAGNTVAPAHLDS